MSQIAIRVDRETSRALAHLVELTGLNRSDVVRDAIRAAEREMVLTRVQQQAQALREDAIDRAEMLAVAEDMESIRAWSPTGYTPGSESQTVEGFGIALPVFDDLDP